MALSQQQALARATDIAGSSDSTRAAYEAACGLWLAYTYGKQWAGIVRGSRYDQTLQRLKVVTQANRTDIRLAMNMIYARVVRLISRQSPRTIKYTVHPATKAANDQTAAMVANARLDLQLQKAGALRVLRKKDLWRTVLGSVVVRRTICNAGEPIIVRDAAGKPKQNRAGKDLTLRTFDHGWACCAPYEFVRDPSAQSVSFDGEDCIGHEKPRPAWWIERYFGKKVQTETTMGTLLEFQRFLNRATGQSMMGSWGESKTKGVMFGEWWFRDDERDAQRRWPWYLITIRDPRGTSQEARQMRVLHFSKNPFDGLPLHHFWYDDQLLSAWGRGVPALCIQAQDTVNLAFTMAFRRLMFHSGPRLMVEEGSAVNDDVKTMTTNRVDVPIVYRQGATKPEYLNPPPMDPNILNVLGQTPDWLDQLLNMSAVQRGEAVKRGEATSAYQLRIEQADTTMNRIIDDDEITANELLTGTLFDIIRTDDPKAVREQLSQEFTTDQIAALFHQDIAASVSGVKVVPDSLRPKTPTEMREDYAAAVGSKMIDPVAARRSLLVRGRVVLDEREARAHRNQLLEVQTLLDGQEVELFSGQEHGMHKYVLELEMDSPRFNSYSDEQRERIIVHWRMHEEAEQDLARERAAIEQMGTAQVPNDIEEAESQSNIIPFPAGATASAGGPLAPAAGPAIQDLSSQPAVAGM